MILNIFHYNADNKSYFFPIIKILISISLIIIMIFREHFVCINNRSISTLITIFCVVMGIVCFLCIEISSCELSAARENRAKDRILTETEIESSEGYSVDEISKMVESNDILEIEIVFEKKPLGIGTSSDSKQGSSKLFNKRYYIGKEEFENIEDFKFALAPYLINGKILVLSIDGVKSKELL